MMIHDITSKVGKYKNRKRLGRGDGSGQGGTAGRGHKGAKSRAGFSYRPHYEGGQMPLFRRIPKRGFSNVQFATHYHIVNLKTLEACFEDGAEVTIDSLIEKRIVRDNSLPLKVLGEGDLTRKLNITAGRFSKSAKEKIEKAGGTATQIAKVKWTRAKARKEKREKEKKEE